MIMYIKRLHFPSNQKDSAEKENDASDSLKDSGFYINLRHAQSILVDERYFKIEFTFWLEPFLVWINGQMYQIDAGAFYDEQCFVHCF